MSKSEPKPKILSVEEILKAPDVKERVVSVPEWGGAVKIRSLTKGASKTLRETCIVDGEFDPDRYEIGLFIASVVEPQFGPEHFEALKAKSSAAMERVLNEALDINGMTQKAQEALERLFRPGNAGSGGASN